MVRFRGTVPLSVVALLIGRSAFAEDASRAQALFDEGRRLMSEGRYPDACPKLAASQKLDPGAGTLMNLATCYERQGKFASAWATFLDAASASRSSGHLDWGSAARERAALLEPKLSRLTIVVPSESEVSGLVVIRDGVSLDRAEWGTPIPVDPGEHTIDVSAPRKQHALSRISLLAGAASSIRVSPLADAVPVAAEPSRTVNEDHPGSTRRVVGLGLIGAGVVGLTMGTVFGVMAKSTHDEALSYCNDSLACSGEGLRLGDKADSQALAATVSFAGGAIAAIAGLFVYFTAPSRSTPSRTSFWLAPSRGERGGAAMGMGGRF